MPKQTLKFTKMHGLGNDFIVFDAMSESISLSSEQARFLCDRHLGVGADQILVLEPSEIADFKMVIYNADGGEVEMCGNGIRCVADYAYRNKIVSSLEMKVETLAGIIKPKILDHGIQVDMGEPILDGAKIPTLFKGDVVNVPLTIHSQVFDVTCVSMGNPHCIIFEETKEEHSLQLFAPWIEQDSHFPNRTNVEFVHVLSKTEINCRVWERGSGITLACGTGACASVAASVLNNKTDRQVKVNLKGGQLLIHWDEQTNHVFMTGPSAEVFSGQVSVK